MSPDLDISDLGTFIMVLYMRVDDLLLRNPHWVPERPAVGIAPKLSDVKAGRVGGNAIAVWVCFSKRVLFVMLGKICDRCSCAFFNVRWYNKRLRRFCEMMKYVIVAIRAWLPFVGMMMCGVWILLQWDVDAAGKSRKILLSHGG